MRPILFLLFLFLGTRAFAVDGQALRLWCTADDKGNRVGFDNMDTPSGIQEYAKAHLCQGYIAGVWDTEVVSANMHHEKMKICLPDSKSIIQQETAVVLKYLENHPEELHYPGTVLVHNALIGAFHCG